MGCITSKPFKHIKIDYEKPKTLVCFNNGKFGDFYVNNKNLYTFTKGLNLKNKSNSYRTICKEVKVFDLPINKYIITALDIYRDKLNVYIEMPKYHQTLLTYTDNNNGLMTNESIDVINNITRGLKYLHDNEIIHNDIKPSNILLNDTTDSCVLADFGFNNELGICGTYGYIAPEKYNGYTDYYNDIWSLGITMLHCISNSSVIDILCYNNSVSPDKASDFTYEEMFKFYINPNPILVHLLMNMLKTNTDIRYSIEDICIHPLLIPGIEKIHHKDTVLIIDDDPVHLKILAQKMKMKNINVHTSNCVMNASYLLSLNKYDCIISDLYMPIVNGNELHEMINLPNFHLISAYENIDYYDVILKSDFNKLIRIVYSDFEIM
uniref:Protein kinase domain-containing protein n=1 Tax=viral metagenome TaxID=1070528 RepID=A0A6C0F5Z8_9ZZZZ|tara:strand:- start:2864 stop:4000 length:1137 start_codon:yes stop_codon:yes gene_type:complete